MYSSSKLEPQLKESSSGSFSGMQPNGRRNIYDILRKNCHVENKLNECPMEKLSHLHPELIFQQVRKYGNVFEMAVIIVEGGIKKEFLGRGHVAILAKKDAARNALSQISEQKVSSDTKGDESEKVDDIHKLSRLHPELIFTDEKRSGPVYSVKLVIKENGSDISFIGRGIIPPLAKKNAAKNALLRLAEIQRTKSDITTKESSQTYQKSEDCPIRRLQLIHPEVTFKENERFGPFYSLVATILINGKETLINGKGVSVDTAKRVAALDALALIESQNSAKTFKSIEIRDLEDLQTKKLPHPQENIIPHRELPNFSQETSKDSIQSSSNTVEREVKTIGVPLDEMEDEHPIPILEKLHPELRFENRPKKGEMCCMAAIISKNGTEMHFEGTGESRKLAKWDAARKMLSVIKSTEIIEEQYPISKLTKLHPELTFELQPNVDQLFRVKAFINVDGKQIEYKGIGPTKKIAKENASVEALTDLKLRREQNKCRPVKYKIIIKSSEDLSDTNSSTESCSDSIPDDENMRNVQDDQDQSRNDLKSPKKRKKVQNLIIGNKNPVSILNELKPGLIYNIKEQLGPAHAPIFKVSVTLNGKEYEGMGRSKKLAKSKAAENALKSFVQFPKADEFNGFQADTKTDFSSEMKERIPCEQKCVQMAPSKGATMLMNELYPNAAYMFEENSKDTIDRFKAVIRLNGEDFVGTGSNKKKAKNAAAMVALTKLLAENPSYANMIQPLRKSTASLEQQAFADRVGRLVNDKFRELMKCDTIHLKRKVLAGIVMTRDEAMNDMVVVCVATGTKCINGENISASGIALNDMHAEIISRRCLINFFYDQLRLQFTKGEEHNSIFEPRPDNRGFRVRNNVKFHLYISTAPCGDARIFSPNDVESVDRHSARSSRGRLRTKIESGEGTIPIKGNDIQTWDGILQGERLLTMSCSDKVARWNVLGLQGSLLSCFVDPIYLSSIVLGSLLNESHMQRAIFGRLENTLQGLPPPYHLNRPYMCPTASAETRVARKAPNFSVNWSIGYERPEIINTTTGKPEEGSSRLCKRIFAKRFLDVCHRVTSMGNVDIPIPKIYADAKLAATNYNQAKEQLFRAFTKANLGSWMKKPLEQDQFQIEDDIF